MMLKSEGFLEIEHTADWELEVWGPSLSSLFEQAARGMYQLCGTQTEARIHHHQNIDLQASDWESLLVLFLSELLYLGETTGLAFSHFKLVLADYQLHGELKGSKLTGRDKEIKAVTYNNLKIEQTPLGYKVRIVFDV